MRPFRLAWGCHVFSKKDTWIIIATTIMSLLALSTTIYRLITQN